MKKLLVFLTVFALIVPQFSFAVTVPSWDGNTPGSSSTSGTSLTFSDTVGTGSNRVLVCGVWDNSGDTINGISYNGTSFFSNLVTKRTDTRAGASRTLYMFELPAPTSGTNSVVVTSSSSVLFGADCESIQDAFQSGADASGSNTSAGATSLTSSMTTVTDSALGIYYARDFTNHVISGTNFTLRTSPAASLGIGDSNGAITPAGSFSMTANDSSSASVEWQGIVAAFAPAPAVTEAPATNPLNFSFWWIML